MALVTDGSYQDCASKWCKYLVEEAEAKGSYVSSSDISTPFNLTEQRRESVKLDVPARDVDDLNMALTKSGLTKIVIPVSDVGSQIADKQREVNEKRHEISSSVTDERWHEDV